MTTCMSINKCMKSFISLLQEAVKPVLGKDTYGKRDQIKKLGGRWNAAEKQWTIDDSKEAELQKIGLTTDPAKGPESGKPKLVPVYGETMNNVDILKKHGARWNPTQKTWYIDPSKEDQIRKYGMTIDPDGQYIGSMSDHSGKSIPDDFVPLDSFLDVPRSAERRYDHAYRKTNLYFTALKRHFGAKSWKVWDLIVPKKNKDKIVAFDKMFKADYNLKFAKYYKLKVGDVVTGVMYDNPYNGKIVDIAYYDEQNHNAGLSVIVSAIYTVRLLEPFRPTNGYSHREAGTEVKISVDFFEALRPFVERHHSPIKDTIEKA